MTDTTTENIEEQPSEGKPLREAMPDEVDHWAAQMWLQDFLYVSPPKTGREYKGIAWVGDED